jgi:hypothetical protein
MAEREDTQNAQPQKPPSRWELEKALLWVVLALGTVIVAHKAWDTWHGQQVQSRTQIGTVVHMSGAGRQLLLETETGFYPLNEPLAAAKGTPLVLEVRGNGERFVCDVAATVCSRTSRLEFTPMRPASGSALDPASRRAGLG